MAIHYIYDSDLENGYTFTAMDISKSLILILKKFNIKIQYIMY